MSTVATNAKIHKLNIVKAYLAIPTPERESLVTWRKAHKINRSEYERLKNDIEREDARLHNVRRVQDSFMAPPILLEEDPERWWKVRQTELNEAIMESALKGNAQSQKLAKQLAGELIEKQEVKIGLTADEIARRNREATRELGEFRNRLGQGVVEEPK